MTAIPYRRLWRRLLYVRFRLLQSHRHNRLALEYVLGLPIVVLPEVFNPKLFRSGEFLAHWAVATVRPGQRVLDLGTGSGVGAVFAARQGAQVVAVDINPAAVRCTTINALVHSLEKKIEVRQGDLFAAVAEERFDVVLFNPPYYTGTPRDPLDGAFRAAGLAERFVAGLPNSLAPQGQAILVLSSDADLVAWRRLFLVQGWRIDVLETKDLINEIVYVWSVTRSPGVPVP
jgi:release factor glutamine methyltransferase